MPFMDDAWVVKGVLGAKEGKKPRSNSESHHHA